jgi:hypothetical protein
MKKTLMTFPLLTPNANGLSSKVKRRLADVLA